MYKHQNDDADQMRTRKTHHRRTVSELYHGFHSERYSQQKPGRRRHRQQPAWLANSDLVQFRASIEAEGDLNQQELQEQEGAQKSKRYTLRACRKCNLPFEDRQQRSNVKRLEYSNCRYRSIYFDEVTQKEDGYDSIGISRLEKRKKKVRVSEYYTRRAPLRAAFLDMTITRHHQDGTIRHKLYDKRRTFKFKVKGVDVVQSTENLPALEP